MSGSVLEGKRTRKVKEYYVPEDHRIKKTLPKEPSDRKNRNKAVGGQNHKWAAYHQLVKRAVDVIAKEEHFMEIRECNDAETQRSLQKVANAKNIIINTLRGIASEHSTDRRWEQLKQGDEEDMIDVNEILCSACGTEEEDGNDILLCDKADCCRAYHQRCLDPVIDAETMNMEKDWFCWQCECLDDCLDVIGEKLGEQPPYLLLCSCGAAPSPPADPAVPVGREYESWQEVFPEMQQLADGPRPDSLNAVILDEEDEEDDEDFLGDDEEDGEEDQDQEGEQEKEQEGEEQEQQDEGQQEEGAEEQQEDEEGDGSDDDDDMSFQSESSLDTDIDEDELTGLLQDADPSAVMDAVSSSTTHTRRLRVRKAVQEDVILLYGQKDVSRAVAKVRRGIVVLGTITAYAASADAAGAVATDPVDAPADAVEDGDGDATGTSTSEPSVSVPTASAVSTEDMPVDAPVLSVDEAAQGVWTVQYNDNSTVQLSAAQIK